MLFVLPVGGADVPIVISLLNAFTGLTVAACGYVLGNVLLLVAGTLVGASGTILTRLMATAMGRSVTIVAVRRARGGSTAGSAAAVGDRPVRSASAGGRRDPARLRAQGDHRARATAWRSRRRSTRCASWPTCWPSAASRSIYGIHPVAGRMPGHMNVLLAEANVPVRAAQGDGRDQPAVRARPTSCSSSAPTTWSTRPPRPRPARPIYGMPILDVDEAQNVVFLKRSMRPGFAGIENELLYEPKTTLLFGDAKDSLTKVVAAVKAL